MIFAFQMRKPKGNKGTDTQDAGKIFYQDVVLTRLLFLLG